MRYGRVQVGLALVSAILGAGFASGREVMRFFTQYGAWGYAGVALAALGMGVLALRIMRLSAACGAKTFGDLCGALLGHAWGRVGTALFLALLTVTGAAMLSGAGELAALVLPMHSAYVVGYVGMMLAALAVAWRGMSGLAACGGVLVPLCCCLYFLLIALPPAETGVALMPAGAGWHALPLAFSYAALNIALSTGLLCESGPRLSSGDQRQAAILGAGCLGALLLLANVVLTRGAGAWGVSALPMVGMASALGKPGYYLSAGALGMAMLTTMATALRGLYWQLPACWEARRRWLGPTAICAVLGMLGFDRLVAVVYPVLGWCAAALIVALCLRMRRPSGLRAEGTEDSH